MSSLGKNKSIRVAQRERRHQRLRKKVRGTAQRPRLVVHRSLKNIEGQLVDDDAGRTLLGLSTLASELRTFKPEGAKRKIEHAFATGKRLAELAKQNGIESVVFDRGGYQYHGRVKAFADGARKGGLSF
jgi:large subunit ribosomal protein L18